MKICWFLVEWNDVTTGSLKIQLLYFPLLFTLFSELFPPEAVAHNPSSMCFTTRDLSSFSTSSCQYGDKESAWKFINSRVTCASVLLIPASIDVFFPMEWARLTLTPHPSLLPETAHCRACTRGINRAWLCHDPAQGNAGMVAYPSPPAPGYFLPYTAWGPGRMYRPWPPGSRSVRKFKSLTSVAWLFDRWVKEKLRPLVS